MVIVLNSRCTLAGLAIYRAALSDVNVSHITVLTRRPIPAWATLPSDASSKTTVVLHTDFKEYPPEVAQRIVNNDACIWALGKSALGMNEAEYDELTNGFVMACLGSLKKHGAGNQQQFRFVFISGEQADPTGRARQMWARVKGRTEVDILNFCKAAPQFKAHIYRPGYFFPSPKYPEDRKNQRPMSARILDYIMTPALSLFAPELLSPIEDLSRFAVEVAKGCWPEQELFRNRDMRELIRQI
ncbi:hypothetical protein WOLCODRAFT_132147 [Wolfiporia cocos MD-104 SS10]|uniref:NAD(P)-binding domain-containing protein n=1 Tax=Wolfiporia cocos (strain MD-104) TaxID=742152 RepID=A0A2H3JYZ3_WOLCO|nr:hypothetical protein WOLCODRAFT_132147 [Wolfiporia cocos MD-104 SS10]